MLMLHDIDQNEVYQAYKNAKNKARQIDILAELNDCSVDDIVVILAGQINRPSIVEKPKQPDFMEILSRQLDELDKDIRGLEVKYKEVTTAMKVLAEIDSMSHVEE